jgi:uncharacterized OB-fold protein
MSEPEIGHPPGPALRYQMKLADGVFEIQKCEDCGKHVFYPRVRCNHCGGVLGWVRPSGAAKVYSTTIVRRKPDEGGDYNVIIAELDEGPRLMSRVDGIPPNEVKIGQSIRAVVRVKGDSAILVFLAHEATDA